MSKKEDKVIITVIAAIGVGFLAATIYHRKKFKPLKVDKGVSNAIGISERDHMNSTWDV